MSNKGAVESVHQLDARESVYAGPYSGCPLGSVVVREDERCDLWRCQVTKAA